MPSTCACLLQGLMAVSLLGIVMWSIGFPIFLFVTLYRKRYRLSHPDVYAVYGFLYEG
jgi:hypothetical protein